jgi:hypothetical protein
MAPRIGSRGVEHPIARLLDDLLGFADRHLSGVFDTGTPVGADESVNLELAFDFPGDRTGDNELIAVLLRRRFNQITFVFDRLSRFRRLARRTASAAEK